MPKNLNSLFGAQDMTVGNPIKVIAKFAIPLLIGNLAQQLYSTVDSVVVGKYCSIERNGYNGIDALSAVGGVRADHQLAACVIYRDLHRCWDSCCAIFWSKG